MDRKTKAEQIFMLLILCVGIMGLLCVSGCGGGKSCEKVKFEKANEDIGKMVSLSVPGCGGCLSPETGCNSVLWAQSCKVSAGCFEDDEGVGKENASMRLVGVNIKYYGSDCIGCGRDEKNAYGGCISTGKGEGKMTGCFYRTCGEEKMFYYDNVGTGCAKTEGRGYEALHLLELLRFVEIYKEMGR